ncbi:MULTISPECIES: PLP-dependent cysteine synthase family protein [Micrococcaceae]|uniref:L-cysteine desulfhydrase Cds1 n=1 Tax=Pseudarthrobacter defluvii TaxID=410837 RepID=A0ABT9UDC4_9MICC|nr:MULTISPECIES: PLP-dependent cysteine synthase family protein [Micrococcaceae]MDE8587943.1 PLP-dependent cysteine synthase family protein [Arthrobacter sp. NQ4]MDQ0117646.1 cysteine synthase A [Pseudarthrobacter defluvii]BCW79226.1 cysteine synthase [Arthrobacter sp. NicSoilC5]
MKIEGSTGTGSGGTDRDWADQAIRTITAENNRSADTHLYSVALPEHWGIQLYLKDESTHRSGSLKHRLARSLFLFGLVNGWIREDTTIVEASSGSTAVSEAYFAQLLGLPFVAVMARTTSPEKIALIEKFGGSCLLVENASDVYAAAEEVAATCNGHYMDQFTYAERATDWRGNNNIAESIFGQLSLEPHPVPDWIVVGAGTGGTSATIGRYLRYHSHPTRLLVVDPENSAFYPGWLGESAAQPTGLPSRIEGIGRARMEPSFIPTVIDRMVQVPDAASVAAMRHLHSFAGLHAGPSTGTNLWGVWQTIAGMLAEGRRGSIVSLMCDGGERYAGNYWNQDWLAGQGLDPAPYEAVIARFLDTGEWTN